MIDNDLNETLYNIILEFHEYVKESVRDVVVLMVKAIAEAEGVDSDD